MTTPAEQQQAQLEQIVTRIARRTADVGAQQNADLCVQLALAQESLDGLAAAVKDRDQQIADRDAELARARTAAKAQAARIAELEAAAEAMTV